MTATAMSQGYAGPAICLSGASFRKFADFITKEAGIKMDDSKVTMLQSRLVSRARTLGLQSLEAYLEYLFDSPAGTGERIHFIDAMTTNKTDFFREPEHFNVLARLLTKSTGSFKVWCAGCSTGEEAYTIAMHLEEHAAKTLGFTYSVLATDLSTKVLTHARAAIYTEDQIEPIPGALRAKYLLRSRDSARREVRIAPVLRGKISFSRLNFMDDPYSVKDLFDAIFFRNVMIYFDRLTQEAVVNKLSRHLATGGHLLVGHSESLASLTVPLRQVAPAVYSKL